MILALPEESVLEFRLQRRKVNVCANDDSGSCRERALEFLDNEEGKETYAKDDSGLCS
jgi:hypothetical protein